MTTSKGKRQQNFSPTLIHTYAWNCNKTTGLLSVVNESVYTFASGSTETTLWPSNSVFSGVAEGELAAFWG